MEEVVLCTVYTKNKKRDFSSDTIKELRASGNL